MFKLQTPSHSYIKSIGKHCRSWLRIDQTPSPCCFLVLVPAQSSFHIVHLGYNTAPLSLLLLLTPLLQSLQSNLRILLKIQMKSSHSLPKTCLFSQCSWHIDPCTQHILQGQI